MRSARLGTGGFVSQGGQVGTGAYAGTGATISRREARELEVIVSADTLATNSAESDRERHQCQASTGQSSLEATHQSEGRT